MTTDTQTIAQFIEKHGITLLIVSGPEPGVDTDAAFSWKHTRWSLKLFTPNGASMLVPEWKQGEAIDRKPDAESVLGCIASDSIGADQVFEDWASEYGMDPDSRKAEAIHKAVQKQDRRLRSWLEETPGDLYAELLDCEPL